MIFVILGALALLVLVTVGRSGKPVRIRREWRFVSTAGAIVCILAGALMAIREAWIPALVLFGLGVSLMGSGRVNLRRRPLPAAVTENMSAETARSILGVEPDATPAEIQAAYRRLMERVHPDKGGAAGLAAQLNAARDRLLRK
jgi:hypothetical protein